MSQGSAQQLARLLIPGSSGDGGGPRPRTPLKSPGTVGLPPASPPAAGLLSSGSFQEQPFYSTLFRPQSRSGSRSRLLSSSPTSPYGNSLWDVYRYPGTRRWFIVLLAMSLVVYTLFIKQSDPTALDTPRESLFRAKLPLSPSDLVLEDGESVEDDAPPVVDRKALDKLRLLDIHWAKQDESNSGITFPDPDLDDDDDRQPELQSPSRGGDSHGENDPAVAAIPDAARRRPNLPERIIRLPASELDRETCADQPSGCAFLVPSYIGDQVHLAQEHLHQLGLLAIALNRTLVLPGTSKSRMGTCQTYGFGLYWNKQSFEDMLGVQTISYAAFLDWAERREEYPTGQLVSMLPATDSYPFGAVEIASSSEPLTVPGRGARNTCLRTDRARLDFEPNSPLAIYPPPTTYHQSLDFGESVIETLRSEELGRKSSRVKLNGGWTRPNVLAINYELRWPIFTPQLAASFAPWLERLPSDFDRFEPAELWKQLAERILDERSPMAVISWRTEQVEGENMVPCVESMVEQLVDTAKKHRSLKSVYISSDFPVDEGDAASPQMLQRVSDEHRDAFERLKDLISRRLPKLDVLTYERVEPEVERLYPAYLGGFIRKAGAKLHKDGRDKPPGVKWGLADLDIALVTMVEHQILEQAEVVLMPGPLVDEEGELVNTCGTGMIGSEAVVEQRREEWASLIDEEEFMREHRHSDVRGLIWEPVRQWP